MKKIIFGSALVMSGLFMTACGDATDALEEGLEGLESEVVDDNSLTCAEVLDQCDDLEGTEVTVKAVSWGSSDRVGGEVSLDLGDVKLEGMQQSHVVAIFSEANAAAAKAVEKDANVTIKAKVGPYEYGAVKLLDPTIVK
jgi:hypothetical protein